MGHLVTKMWIKNCDSGQRCELRIVTMLWVIWRQSCELRMVTMQWVTPGKGLN